MSTVIDNFFVLNTNKMAEIDRQNKVIEEIANKIAKEAIYKSIIDDFVLFENETSLQGVFEKSMPPIKISYCSVSSTKNIKVAKLNCMNSIMLSLIWLQKCNPVVL